MLPKKVATIKHIGGIPTNGDARFTNQPGMKGVSLKNIM